MAPSGKAAPPQRWNGLVSASMDAFKQHEPAAPDELENVIESAAETPAVGDLISKAALAVEAHANSAQLSRARMARLSADSAASLRSAIIGETPTGPGKPAPGVTSGTRLDVQR